MTFVCCTNIHTTTTRNMQQMDTQCTFSGPFASSVGVTFNLKPFCIWLKPASTDVTAWNRTKGWKRGFFCVNYENSERNIRDIKWRTFHNWLYKTSKQHVREKRKRKKKSTHCNNRIPHIACHLPHKRHTVKWCLPSQTIISIPSLMWRPRGTLKRLAREMLTQKYRALYKG